MRTTLSEEEMSRYVAEQLNRFFPDADCFKGADLAPHTRTALMRAEHCFSHINQSYFWDQGELVFTHYNTIQYCMYLYMLANTVHHEGGERVISEKLFALNKLLHGLDLFFEIELPRIFLLQHPMGTVLGRATYNDYFCIYQGCSVGSNLDGVFPKFGEGTVLLGGSRVNGDCTLGNNCWIAPGAVVLDTDVPSDSVTFGLYPDTQSKPTDNNVVGQFFLRGD